MASFNRELEVKYTPIQMYELVDDIDSYPKFLPWCVGSSVKKLDDKYQEATLVLEKGLLKHEFTTLNEHNRDGLIINVSLAKGPLKHLKGKWHFTEDNKGGCVIKFQIDYSFANRVLNKLLGPLFAGVYEHMVTAFAKRAEEIYE